MQFISLHPNFQLPTRGSEFAGALDLYMPEDGYAYPDRTALVPLGFAAAVPDGHVGLLLPRSSTGAKFGLELNNTVGVIDADYRGEWKAALKTKNHPYSWAAGDRVLQVIIVPTVLVQPCLVAALPPTQRGAGGFGSSGQ